MAEVLRAEDLHLGRVVALKVLRADRAMSSTHQARFREEVALTSSLIHPGVPPVYDEGLASDGRPFFAMPVLGGRTLSKCVEGLQVEPGRAAAPGWSRRRLLEGLERASEVVGFAHERQVVHRDLSPRNIWLGDYGEVWVLDWGMASAPGRSERQRPPSDGDQGGLETRAGGTLGTAGFLPPEQAPFDPSRLGAPSDVYALGANLYLVLSGRAPWAERERGGVAEAVRHPVPPPPVPDDLGPNGAALVDLCMRALSQDPGGRPPNASAFAQELRAWREGAQRREQAARLVREGRVAEARAQAYARAFEQQKREAWQRLRALPGWTPFDAKEPIYAQEEAAEALGRQAREAGAEAERHGRAALRLDPDLPEGYALLADHYQRLQAEHERAGRKELEGVYEALLATYDRAGAHQAWLRGDGALTLVTDPPGARVRVLRQVAVRRRLVDQLVGEFGPTPLVRVPLARGSYVLELLASGHTPVRYPVRIRRLEHWDGVPPGAGEPLPVRLPVALGPDEVYVPAGRFSSGDPIARNGLLHDEIWVPGFVVRRFQVTWGEWLAFLDDLVATGRRDEAARCLPRYPTTQDGLQRPLVALEPGAPARTLPDQQAVVAQDDWPVYWINRTQARAWARWEAARTGLPWRLPYELELEKAARGVDGRIYPWGDQEEPTWCRCSTGRAPGDARAPVPVDSYAEDTSVYGLRGFTGNIRDMTEGPLRGNAPVIESGVAVCPVVSEAPDADRYAYVGGAWSGSLYEARIGTRLYAPDDHRNAMLGFRVARAWPGT